MYNNNKTKYKRSYEAGFRNNYNSYDKSVWLSGLDNI